MTDVVAEVSTTIAAPRSAVWHALTDAELSSEYTLGGATVETDWQVGSPVTWTGEWNGQEFRDKGEILANEPEQRLSYSHWSPMGGTDDAPENYHVVTLSLDEADGGTLVTLTQTNLDGSVSDDDREHRADFERNWATMLADLRSVAER
ncbi:SRPBCC family protein [Dermatobacter hominis]|uniref:SRPBCC family protein n=1 Tax=Dermatobacter hominis TaxID=2884263 RepID=UPI001D12157A|nr:SRPBCC domain-containing protein [Dermatobacter hominis]UDY37524.1 SRPBCC domain-containing protein [Dermatobacter hominis]